MWYLIRLLAWNGPITFPAKFEDIIHGPFDDPEKAAKEIDSHAHFIAVHGRSISPIISHHDFRDHGDPMVKRDIGAASDWASDKVGARKTYQD